MSSLILSTSPKSQKRGPIDPFRTWFWRYSFFTEQWIVGQVSIPSRFDLRPLVPPKGGLASAFPSREGSTIFIDSWYTLRSMLWDCMIVIMGNSHLKSEHYLILNTPTEVKQRVYSWKNGGKGRRSFPIGSRQIFKRRSPITSGFR